MPYIVLVFSVALGGAAVWWGYRAWVTRQDTDRAAPWFTTAAALVLLGILVSAISVALDATVTVVPSAVCFAAALLSALTGIGVTVVDSYRGYQRQRELHPDQRVRWWWPRSIVITAWVIGALAAGLGFVYAVFAATSMWAEHYNRPAPSDDDPIYQSLVVAASALVLLIGVIGAVHVCVIRPRAIRRHDKNLAAGHLDADPQ